MTIGVTVEGFGLRLRPVEVEDGAFILGLRRNPALSRFIGETPDDLAAQEAWIRRQRAREHDFYYLCETCAGRALGAVGIYGCQARRAEWGRWVLAEGSAAAVGCAYLILELGLNELGMDVLFSQTIAANVRVVSFHESLGARRVIPPSGEETSTLHGRRQPVVRHEVDGARWRQIRPRLAPLAAAARTYLE